MKEALGYAKLLRTSTANCWFASTWQLPEVSIQGNPCEVAVGPVSCPAQGCGFTGGTESLAAIAGFAGRPGAQSFVGSWVASLNPGAVEELGLGLFWHGAHQPGLNPWLT